MGGIKAHRQRYCRLNSRFGCGNRNHAPSSRAGKLRIYQKLEHWKMERGKVPVKCYPGERMLYRSCRDKGDLGSIYSPRTVFSFRADQGNKYWKKARGFGFLAYIQPNQSRIMPERSLWPTSWACSEKNDIIDGP